MGFFSCNPALGKHQSYNCNNLQSEGQELLINSELFIVKSKCTEFNNVMPFLLPAPAPALPLCYWGRSLWLAGGPGVQIASACIFHIGE